VFASGSFIFVKRKRGAPVLSRNQPNQFKGIESFEREGVFKSFLLSVFSNTSTSPAMKK